MTTCPEKSRVNISSSKIRMFFYYQPSYQFYGIVGVFIKNDFMMSFSSSSHFLPLFLRVRVPRKEGNKNRKFLISSAKN